MMKHHAGIGFVLYPGKEHAEKGTNVHASMTIRTIRRSRAEPKIEAPPS
jgi:hypothetical protein